MSIVQTSVRMSVNDHYRIVQEMEDGYQEVIDNLYDDRRNWKKMYIDLAHEKWRIEDELSELKKEMGK